MRPLLIATALLATLSAETPTPRRIAVSRTFGNSGQVGLFIAASDGSGERPLLYSPDTDYDPVWAPDGYRSFSRPTGTDRRIFFGVNPDGTGLTPLTTDPAYDDQAAFSPDSKQLVFVSTRGGGTANLWTMDLATRRAKALTTGKGGDFVRRGRPTESGSRSPRFAATRCLSRTAGGSGFSWRISTSFAPMAPG